MITTHKPSAIISSTKLYDMPELANGWRMSSAVMATDVLKILSSFSGPSRNSSSPDTGTHQTLNRPSATKSRQGPDLPRCSFHKCCRQKNIKRKWRYASRTPTICPLQANHTDTITSIKFIRYKISKKWMWYIEKRKSNRQTDKDGHAFLIKFRAAVQKRITRGHQTSSENFVTQAALSASSVPLHTDFYAASWDGRAVLSHDIQLTPDFFKT